MGNHWIKRHKRTELLKAVWAIMPMKLQLQVIEKVYGVSLGHLPYDEQCFAIEKFAQTCELGE